MKKGLYLLLAAALLIGCAKPAAPELQKDPRMESAAVSVPNVTPIPASEANPSAPFHQPDETSEAGESLSLAQRAAAAWDEQGLLNGMVPYSDSELLDYYGIDLSVCRSGIGYADAVGYTNEIVLIEADETEAARVKELLLSHLDAAKDQFRSYDPEALALVEKAVLLQEGGTVLMIVSPESDALLAVWRSLGA